MVTREAEGAPAEALPEPMAPMAPEPLVPVRSTPLKLVTVIEEATLWERVAETVTLLRAEVAKALQISEVPAWVLVRTTRTQFKPAPVTLVTEVLAPEE